MRPDGKHETLKDVESAEFFVPAPLIIRQPLLFTIGERLAAGSGRPRLRKEEAGVSMALALHWRRAVITGAGLLALGACEATTVADAPEETAPIVDRSPRVAGEIARGRQALAAGDYPTAQAAFTAALRGSPNDPDPAIGLAETYLAVGDLETAGRLFDIVAGAEADAGDPRLLQGRGLVALGQGRTDEAMGLLEQAVDRDPSLWRAWAALGRAHGRQGNSRRSRAAFDRAEDAAPSPAVVMNDMGMLNLEQNDPAAALEAFQRALAVDPGNAIASANARIARAMLGDYDAAISGARPGELPDVLNNVGYIAVVNGDFDTADRLLRRAVEVSPAYHEAAIANLDLLAQARKGVPVLALAGPGGAASRSTAGAELSSTTALPGEIGTAAPTPDGIGGIAGPVSAEPAAGDATPPRVERASVPAQQSRATEGVMAHGFRWDAKPIGAAAPRARRSNPAQSGDAPEASDPRGSAWPAIAVPPPEPAVATPEPEADQAASGAQRPEADRRTASTGPKDAAPAAARQASEPGLPE